MSDEVTGVHFDRMRGRLLGLIESWGLPAVQERGAKSLLKSLSYDAEKEITAVITALREELAELQGRMRGLEK